MNTGAAFPETIELMASVRKMVPHFVEVNADVVGSIALHGAPVDVLPVKSSDMAYEITSMRGLRMRSWVDCCRENLWTPMDNACRELGATTIIRGQRLDEDYKAPATSGTVYNGVTYEFPIEGWTEQEVTAYLKDQDIPLPAYYDFTKKSLDCWACTAFLDEKPGLFAYMRERHPEKYAQVADKIREIARITVRELAPLQATLNELGVR